jgi:hypothetical protein
MKESEEDDAEVDNQVLIETYENPDAIRYMTKI